MKVSSLKYYFYSANVLWKLKDSDIFAEKHGKYIATQICFVVPNIFFCSLGRILVEYAHARGQIPTKMK